MQFETDAQKACYEKIVPWMKEEFGSFARTPDDAPVVLVDMPASSALVAVWVLPWGNDDASIRAHSFVVMGAQITPDLMKFLLEANANVRFGGFGLDDDGDILFTHAIVGSTCDKLELKASVMAVLSTADQLDDQIVAKWGGQRALDQVKGV